jgi:Protein of unknown function (DUF3775)
MDETSTLSISPEKVCYIISKARQFEAKDVVADPESGSNAADDRMVDVFEDQAEDPVYEELTAFIATLDEDEQVDLIALTWLGRAMLPSMSGTIFRARPRALATSAPPPICWDCHCCPSIWRKAFPNLAARVKIEGPPPLFVTGMVRRQNG